MRYITRLSSEDITKNVAPEKSLIFGRKSNSGRNSDGRVTSRFRGGGHKKLQRIVDFRGYDKIGIPARVAAIHYDPNRTSRLALLHFVDGEKRYVIAWKGCSIGDIIQNGGSAPITAGNRLQLKDIPEGVNIFNIEVIPFTKGKLIRSAGMTAILAGSTGNGYRIVKLPSGETRRFNENCWATIGQVGAEDHRNIVIGKAGRQRRLGVKPHVLGKSMNAVDHPHGGGEGHTSLGMKSPKTRTGRKVAPGMKTRKK
ncbi:MAG: 50S ribosomal protein L2, partial [Candidatus Absconditabacterales bacterium]|nr:50S ribosomal protein L2 [Candidatus Absconditabacterales bacterium]